MQTAAASAAVSVLLHGKAVTQAAQIAAECQCSPLTYGQVLFALNKTRQFREEEVTRESAAAGMTRAPSAPALCHCAILTSAVGSLRADSLSSRFEAWCARPRKSRVSRGATPPNPPTHPNLTNAAVLTLAWQALH